MSYRYEDLKPKLFSDEGQREFLKTRDRAHRLIETAGAFTASKAMGSGDSWFQLACLDRMVELGELHELTDDKVWAQLRVFIGTARVR